MRIGLFTDTYPPNINGVATSVCMLKKALEKKGHQVFLVTVNPDNMKFVYEDNGKTIKLPGLPDGIYDYRLSGIYPIRVVNKIKKWKLDVIHSHTEFGVGTFARLISKQLNIPLVHTYHTMYEDYVHYITHGYFNKSSKKLVEYLTLFYCDTTANELIVPTKKTWDLFKEKYIREDISERIRLFYVALTRCREKMILVGEVENKTINKSDSKLNYRSFLDIINSVYSSIADYIVDIPISSIPLSKDYNLATALDYKKLIPKSDCVVKLDNISIENNTIEEKKFSKVSPSLLLSSTRDKMELGRKIHHYLECIDFLNPDFTNVDKRYVPYIKQFLESEIDFNNCTIYKEYEFMYNDGCNSGHGIIDLMLVYDDHIQIIDYKLNNIVDEAYKNQLTAYREYIQSKTTKNVTTYLYSVFTGVLKEV